MLRAVDRAAAWRGPGPPRPSAPMDFRPLIPLAPAALRPILSALLAWMDRTDRRLEQLEAHARNSQA